MERDLTMRQSARPCAVPRKGRAIVIALLSALALAFGAEKAGAADGPRVASINMCTDQMVLALVDPPQIAGLSPYARDPLRSWSASEAGRYRLLSGEAEDVLVLKPDVVVAGSFTKRATRELLKEKGLRVEEFDAAQSIDDARRQILRMGEIVGHAGRAGAVVARIDAAVEQAKAAVARRPLSVLPLERRGWAAGGESLTSSLLEAVGLSNAASRLGLKLGGLISLETIISLRPDLLLVSDSGNLAEDEGQALLLHPALEAFYPPSKRLVIPEKLTVCGGPMLADALDRLVKELERIGR